MRRRMRKICASMMTDTEPPSPSASGVYTPTIGHEASAAAEGAAATPTGGGGGASVCEDEPDHLPISLETGSGSNELRLTVARRCLSE